jgi:hypothetical protein
VKRNLTLSQKVYLIVDSLSRDFIAGLKLTIPDLIRDLMPQRDSGSMAGMTVHKIIPGQARDNKVILA